MTDDRTELACSRFQTLFGNEDQNLPPKNDLHSKPNKIFATMLDF